MKPFYIGKMWGTELEIDSETENLKQKYFYLSYMYQYECTYLKNLNLIC